MNKRRRSCVDNCKNFSICKYSDLRPAWSCLQYVPTENMLALANESIAKLPAEAKEINPKYSAEIRKFDTGATRDTVDGKLNYRKALSPVVLQRYVQYLNAHRKQADGSMRDFDNWKKGIPIEAYFEGLGRHDMAVWLLHDEFPAEDNHGPVDIEDTLCAIIFNASGWLHELLKEEK